MTKISRVLIIYEINHIWTAEMKWKWRNDRRSERNLCNCVKKPGKKNSGLQRGLNPWPRDYRFDALPTELWSHWRWEQVNCGFICSRKWNECERFEPRSHFKSRLSLIARVNVVLNRTVVVDSDWRFNNLCGSHLQSQSELYHVSWWYILWLLIWLVNYVAMLLVVCQLSRDVIGYEDS